jgi:hypothetical protein
MCNGIGEDLTQTRDYFTAFDSAASLLVVDPAKIVY